VKLTKGVLGLALCALLYLETNQVRCKLRHALILLFGKSGPSFFSFLGAETADRTD
jgi:hypothetical protein